jgi:hypothetical protein
MRIAGWLIVSGVSGSKLTAVDRLERFPGRLAQLGERRLDKAEVTGSSPVSPTDYASAVSRVAMHGTPPVVAAWRSFQDNATTETPEGRALMVAAIQATRTQLGHGPASDGDLHVLLFGPGGPRR